MTGWAADWLSPVTRVGHSLGEGWLEPSGQVITCRFPSAPAALRAACNVSRSEVLLLLLAKVVGPP